LLQTEFEKYYALGHTPTIKSNRMTPHLLKSIKPFKLESVTKKYTYIRSKNITFLHSGKKRASCSNNTASWMVLEQKTFYKSCGELYVLRYKTQFSIFHFQNPKNRFSLVLLVNNWYKKLKYQKSSLIHQPT